MTKINEEQYKDNLKNISKFYITKKFQSAFELCEECVKNYEIDNPINIFNLIKDDDSDYEDEYNTNFLKKKEEKNEENQIKRTIIPSDLLQIYLKIIEQIKPEIDCWNVLNKFYQNVNEIPSKILTTCSLIEVKKNNLENSKNNIRKWLREMPKEEKEKLREKKQPEFKFYEMIIEIYILHTLVPLEEYNNSIDFLEGDDHLTMDRKKLICDKVVKIESQKEKAKQMAKDPKTERKVSNNKNLFSKFTNTSDPATSSTSIPNNTSRDINNTKDIVKKSKQKKINNKRQNKYDIGNAVIDGSYDPFWKILSKFLIDKAPLLLIIVLLIVFKKHPELIRGTIIEKILKKLYETIMIIININ